MTVPMRSPARALGSEKMTSLEALRPDPDGRREVVLHHARILSLVGWIKTGDVEALASSISRK
jgi:hypothetical protein